MQGALFIAAGLVLVQVVFAFLGRIGGLRLATVLELIGLAGFAVWLVLTGRATSPGGFGDVVLLLLAAAAAVVIVAHVLIARLLKTLRPS